MDGYDALPYFVAVVAYIILLVVIIGKGSDIVAALNHLARTVTLLARNVDHARDDMQNVPARILAAHDQSLEGQR